MAWAKENAPIILVNITTGAWETTAHTVEVQPTTSAYPTGKISCSQLASGYTYLPDSDLDEYTHYWVYIDTVQSGKKIAWASEPAFGGA